MVSTSRAITLERRAEGLQNQPAEAVTLNWLACNFFGCGGVKVLQPFDDDDGFPAWAIAISVVLPVLAAAAIIFVILWFCCPQCFNKTPDEAQNQPYGDREAGEAPKEESKDDAAAV